MIVFLRKHQTVNNIKQKVPILNLGLIILIGSLYYSFRNTDINLVEKLRLQVVLSNNPSSHHFSTSLKFYDDIKFNAEGFKKGFIIDNFEYKASLYHEIINTLKKGDTVSIWIDNRNEKNDYTKIYALEYKGNNYINVSQRNVIKSRYNKYGLIVAFYGIFLLANIYFRKGLRLTTTKAVAILLLILIGIYRITK